jgi:hypothetical protein
MKIFSTFSIYFSVKISNLQVLVDVLQHIFDDLDGKDSVRLCQFVAE